MRRTAHVFKIAGLAAATVFWLSPLTGIAQTSPGGVRTSADCLLWLDAGDIDGDGDYSDNPAVNSNVATWADKSGNDNDLTQGTNAARPSYATLGGIACLYFSNTGTNADYMDATNQTMLTPGTMFFVLNMVDAGDGGNCLFERNGNNFTSLRFEQWNGTDQLGYTKYGVADYVSTISSSYNSNIIVSYRKTSASDNVVINQNNASVNLTVGSTNPGLPLYTLGKNGTTDGMNGYIMEALAYDVDLPLAQRTIIDNYLSAKYGGISILADRYAGDTPGNGNYDFELGGVGTESDGSNTSVASTISGGLAVAQGGTAMGNGEYLLFAHQSGANALDFFDVGGMSAGLNRARWRRVWYFDWTHIGGSNENVNLTFDISDAGSVSGNAATPLSNYKLLYRAGQSGNWTEVMNASSITGDRITFNGLVYTQGDGYYTIGTLNNALSPLPIELLSFDAESCDANVCLDWSCATEKNTSHFLVERSKDGESWTTVTTLAAAGNTFYKTMYSAIDRNPYNGTSYYRITTVDRDDTRSHSPLRTAQVKAGEPEITVFPNPTEGMITIVPSGYDAYALSVELMDKWGRKIDVTAIVSDDGTLKLNLQEQPDGIYFLKINTVDGSSVVKRVVKE